MPIDPGAEWTRAVEYGARGRYADAEATCTTLIEIGGRWRSLGLSTLASHRRQIGAVEAAEEFDARALDSAVDPESHADALVGLAADAVARADATAAERRHAEAASTAGQSWRTLTRWHWVGAELGLLVADHDLSLMHVDSAIHICTEHSHRHRVKSVIIRAAVTGEVGALVEAAERLDESDWVTLEWPLALVAADHAGSCDRTWLTRIWRRGVEATFRIEQSLPTGLHVAWRSHAGVVRLRSGEPTWVGE